MSGSEPTEQTQQQEPRENQESTISIPQSPTGKTDQQQKELSEEEAQQQKELAEKAAEIAEKANALVGSDKTIQPATAVLLLGRRLQLAALTDIRSRLSDELEIDADMTDGILRHIAASMNYASQRPFSRDELVNSTQALLLPWLIATNESKAEEARREAMQAAQAEENARKERDLVLPALGDIDEEGVRSSISCSRSAQPYLVWGDDLQEIEELFEEAAGQASLLSDEHHHQRVLHLTTRDIGQIIKREKGYLQTVSPKAWVGKLTNPTKIAKFLDGWLHRFTGGGIDIVFVDELAKCQFSETEELRPAAVGNVLRGISRWVKQQEAVVIGGFKLDAEEWPSSDQSYDSLTVYSTQLRVDAKQKAED